ncbi:MAG: hypothetical protein WD076_05340, partial [Parvularculaceae bacterium]
GPSGTARGTMAAGTTFSGARRRLADPALWLLAAGFLAGLAHLFVTPPFEGFDETAHYASVQLVADQRRIPVYGKDRFAKDVLDYERDAPKAYAPVPPFEKNGGLTYADVFSTPERAATARAMIGEEPARARAYWPAGPLNWQAQHPPLAYVLLAPVYHATKSQDWKSHLFFLRLACFSVAMLGLAIGVLATRERLCADRSPLATMAPAIMAAWPFYAPMFFPEMARLGNDGFCLLFASLAWAAFLRFERTARGRPERLQWAVLLGLSLGMGALTKAFFLPVAAGFAALLALREAIALKAEARRGARRLLSAFLPVAAMASVFLAVAFWWYAGKYAATGSFTGANDLILARDVAASSASHSEAFSLALFGKRLLSVYLSFLWAGTWSLAKMPYAAVAILGFFFALVSIPYYRALFKGRRFDALVWAPVFMVMPVVIGLGYHIATQMALGEARSGTPGWYLHIFAAPLGFAYAIGVAGLWRAAWGRLALGAGFLYTLLFAVVAAYYQLALFTGCAVKLGDNRYYQPAACFGDVAEIWRRLEIIANPALGIAAIILAAGAAIGAVFLIIDRRALISAPRAAARSPAP